MISLFLDTSTKNITISIIKDFEQIYFFHEEIFEDLSVKILPLIDDALKECSLKINDINVSVRGTVGGDIKAACGQLRANNMK